MKDMIIAVVVALCGILLVGASVYYLVKEKNDRESKKIYTTSSLIGAVVAVGALIRIIFLI